MWYKLSDNFNQILPISWSNTKAMKFLLPYLIGDKNLMSKYSLNESTNYSLRTNLEKRNISIKDYLEFRYDDLSSNHDESIVSSEDTNLDNQLIDDDQIVLNSYCYDYSTCRLHATGDYSIDRGFDDSLNRTLNKTNHFSSYLNEFENEYEEQLCRDLDFHSLIIYSHTTETDEQDGKQLLFTAEEVLKELDIILSEDDHLNDTIDVTETVIDQKILEQQDNQTIDYNYSTNANYSNETDELDDELAKETLLDNAIYQNNKFFKFNLIKPFGGHTNSIGTSFSSNSLDDVLSTGYSLSRSQTSSSQISSGIDNGGGGSFYGGGSAVKNQNEIQNEKQLFEEQLRKLNIKQLNEIYLDLEKMIQNHSEILISELNLKDELEYEKELKNQVG